MPLPPPTTAEVSRIVAQHSARMANHNVMRLGVYNARFSIAARGFAAFGMALLKHQQERGKSRLTMHNQLSTHLSKPPKIQPPPGKKVLPLVTKSKMGKRKTRRAPRKKLMTDFPDTQLIQMNSYHMLTIDPGASSAVAICDVNIANPLDPITPGAGCTLTSTEHHPKNWTVYENLYDKFEVISAKVDVHFMGNQSNLAHSYFICPASTINKDELLDMADTVKFFSARLKEAYPRAIVKALTGTSSESNSVKLFSKVNLRKLEGIKKGSADTALLQGQTKSSGTEAAPARDPVVIFGLGSISGTSDDLSFVPTMVKIEYICLFSGRTGDSEGQTIA